MEEKILVPLDGSKVGETALPYVEDLVSKLSPQVKVTVILLQVITSQTHYIVAGGTAVPIDYTQAEVEQIKRRATKYLKDTGKDLKSKGGMVKAKVAVGKAADEIIKTAEEMNVNLIVFKFLNLCNKCSTS